MKKLVKRYGNTLVITFNVEDVKIYGMVEGSVIDLSDMRVLDEKKIADSDITKICGELYDDKA